MNILDGFIKLKRVADFQLQQSESGNSIQMVGGQLERFIKDLFADSLDVTINEEERLRKRSSVFSYHGNANNPPDAILRNGDAIEIKKVDSPLAEVHFNSSWPKQKLRADDARINNSCRVLANEEGWSEKDIFYVIGSQSGNQLTRLWMVYGDCLAASNDVYNRITQRVTDSIKNDFDEDELGDTKEIASVPNVDPLNRTRLRVRGMWMGKNPSLIFRDYIKNAEYSFKAYCVLKKDKFESFNDQSISDFEAELDDKMSIIDIDIPDPDNPAAIIEARLIKYEV